MEYADLSDFLRKRREALQPEDVGLPLPLFRPWNPLLMLVLLPVSLVAALAGGPSRTTLRLRKPRG